MTVYQPHYQPLHRPLDRPWRQCIASAVIVTGLLNVLAWLSVAAVIGTPEPVIVATVGLTGALFAAKAIRDHTGSDEKISVDV